MNKSLVMLFMFIGSTAGAYAPKLFGVSTFSFTSIIAGTIGGLAGIWLAVKFFSF